MAWEKSGLDNYYHLIKLKELELSKDVELEEDTESFEGDALKKAEEYCKTLNLPTISIDRGIEFMALNGWPGTKTKEAFSGSDKTIFDFEALNLNLSGDEDDIKRSRTILDRIKNKNRGMKSVYGIAVAFPDGEKISDLVAVQGRASEELKITSTGYFYDWFFIPKGYDKTLSEFSEYEYFKLASEILWPISKKIKKFLIGKY